MQRAWNLQTVFETAGIVDEKQAKIIIPNLKFMEQPFSDSAFSPDDLISVYAL